MRRVLTALPLGLTGCFITADEANSWYKDRSYRDSGWGKSQPDSTDTVETGESAPTPEDWLTGPRAGTSPCISQVRPWTPLDVECSQVTLPGLGPDGCAFRVLQDGWFPGALRAQAHWSNGSDATEATLYVATQEDGTLGSASSATGDPEVSLTVPAEQGDFMFVLVRRDDDAPELLEATMEVCQVW